MHRNLPAEYVDTYKFYARQGARVIALGWKDVQSMAISKIRGLDRDLVEQDFNFAGMTLMCASSGHFLSTLRLLGLLIGLLSKDPTEKGCLIRSGFANMIRIDDPEYYDRPDQNCIRNLFAFPTNALVLRGGSWRVYPLFGSRLSFSPEILSVIILYFHSMIFLCICSVVIFCFGQSDYLVRLQIFISRPSQSLCLLFFLS